MQCSPLFLMTANTKAWGEALIEATEWHAQSNWISSAVSSNLIWPALWRMTGERNTFSCLPLPLGVPHTHTQRPTDVPLPCDNWPTSAAWAATAHCLDRPAPPLLLLLPLLRTPRRPLLHCVRTFCAPLCYLRPPRLSPPSSHLAHLELGPLDTPRSQGSVRGRVEEMKMARQGLIRTVIVLTEKLTVTLSSVLTWRKKYHDSKATVWVSLKCLQCFKSFLQKGFNFSERQLTWRTSRCCTGQHLHSFWGIPIWLVYLLYSSKVLLVVYF